MFVDDDVRACPGWLEALLDGGPRAPAGRRLHRTGDRAPGGACARAAAGARRPPITTLDLGEQDTRRRARVGREHGDPPLRARTRRARSTSRSSTAATSRSGRNGCAALRPQARSTYLSRARASSTAAPAPTRGCGRCAATAYTRGRAARRFDARRGGRALARGRAADARGLPRARARHACPAGLMMVAHSGGQRCAKPLRAQAGAGAGPRDRPADADDFLSGQSGAVGGLDGARAGAAATSRSTRSRS